MKLLDYIVYLLCPVPFRDLIQGFRRASLSFNEIPLQGLISCYIICLVHFIS